MQRVENGRYTLSDRKGKSLASGGDVQLVLTGIDIGYAAGVTSLLEVKHLIDTHKANFTYLRKQQYGAASAYIKAYNQVFSLKKIETRAVTSVHVVKRVYSLYRNYGKTIPDKNFQLLLASKLGEMSAMVYASDKRKPIVLKCFEKLLHV
ncbi:MAG: hypothetical protein EOO46_14815 [Flavobacterium sp.]|nr:MAG: hypothetical protein EOO46_14815 [Flavobacterium sp.]